MEIREFSISGRPIVLTLDHSYLCVELKDGCTKDVNAKSESWLANYQFNWETINVYSSGIQWHGRFRPFCILEEGLSKSLHKSATNALPHTTSNAPKSGKSRTK